MDNLNQDYLKEQETISNAGAWIWLVEIRKTGYTTRRYTNNNSAVGTNLYVDWPTGNSHRYYAAPLSIDDTAASLDGKFPEYKLGIGEVDLSSGLRSYIVEANGYVGGTVRMIIVHSAHLGLTTPAVDEYAEILNCDVTADAVVFTLGIPSMLNKRFPRDKYVAGFCRHKFAGALCQYTKPPYYRQTNDISFAPGIINPTTGLVYYNTIRVASGRLIEDIFSHSYPPGTDYAGPPRRFALAKDIGFTISGSQYNDGQYLADMVHLVYETYVRVKPMDTIGMTFYAEDAGNLITIQLGNDNCDHTLAACKLRNNLQNYGGSPGMVGGVYG
jgi:phage-related protein